MSKFAWRALAGWIGIALSCFPPGPAHAGNGLNMIGFGAESIGMGGADLAVARDTSAMNTNPAGLAQIPGRRMDMSGAVLYALSVNHSDRLGNDADTSNPWILFGSGGYAHRWGESPVVLGIGFFAQGGAGNVYENLMTPFGNRDELSSQFRIAKLTPSAAYRVSDALFLGASLQVVYSAIEQKVFPNTSYVDPTDPSNAFFGIDAQDMDGIGVGAKIGILYRVSQRFAVGAAYTTRIRLPLENGEVTADMEAAGLGKVTYRDAEIEGLELPQELGIGIAVRPVDSLLLALDVSWLDWSDSIRTTTLRATDPDTPGAPPVLTSSSSLNWRDQYVIAFGLAYDATERTVLRAGYNYGRNPIPDETLSPILATFSERSITAGVGYQISREWRIDTAVEYALPGEETYYNPQLPFGPGTRETGEVIGFHFMLSKVL
jgi:long-chain fatty acid transport protein